MKKHMTLDLFTLREEKDKTFEKGRKLRGWPHLIVWGNVIMNL